MGDNHMTKRVLFVDDEQSLLNGIERRLAGQFDLATANSGAAAVDLMASSGPFAVVVTDMRMPKMDGVQLIKEARGRWPDTVYIMLTGNQDQLTAVQALNEGHVFRFLTKPCQSSDLIKAVEAGLRQFQLETGEKELLQKTFCGAVSVLTDVLALSHPNIFSRTERIEHICAALQEELGLGEHWEYKLAAKLGLLGFALQPESERMNVDMGTQLGGVVSDQFRRAAATGQRLIERIPRLATVAKIIGRQPDVDGSVVIQVPRTDEAKANMGATLLRVAMLWDDVARQGLHGLEAVEELRRSLPKLSREMGDALLTIPVEDMNETGVDIRLNELKEGMVLCDDIVSDNGSMLIRKGRRLTWTVIERLHNSQVYADRSRSIRIRESTVNTSDRLILA
jgi:CheY-like chemotaxis protein